MRCLAALYVVGVCLKMVDHIVETEGPIYFDVLVDRISRAHGFQRAAERIRGIVRAALGSDRVPITKEDDRVIVWPSAASPGADPLSYHWAKEFAHHAYQHLATHGVHADRWRG